MSVKELTMRLEELANSFVAEMDSTLCNKIGDEIKDLLLIILIEEEGKFGVIVSQKLINKLIPHEVSLIEKSRKKWRNDGSEVFVPILQITRELIDFIFSEYEKQLTGTKVYTKHRISVIEQNQSILNPEAFLLDNILWFSTNRYKADIDKERSRILSYFNERSINNLEAYKNELFSFVFRLNKEIDVADDLINCVKKNKDKYHTMLISGEYLTELSTIPEITDQEEASEQINHVGEEQYDVDDPRYYSDEYYKRDEDDPKDHYMDLFIEANDEYENRLQHKKMLIDLLDELRSSHMVLASYTSSESIPTTVFGSLNYDAMGLFYKELQFFLPKTVTQEQIFKAFSISDQHTNMKIELTNGSLNDYGHLINELHPLFIPQLKPSAKYNQWWAERFVFSGTGTNRTEKDAEAIKKIRSASKQGRSNSVSKRSIIASIVSEIAKNPQ